MYIILGNSLISPLITSPIRILPYNISETDIIRKNQMQILESVLESVSKY